MNVAELEAPRDHHFTGERVISGIAENQARVVVARRAGTPEIQETQVVPKNTVFMRKSEQASGMLPEADLQLLKCV